MRCLRAALPLALSLVSGLVVSGLIVSGPAAGAASASNATANAASQSVAAALRTAGLRPTSGEIECLTARAKRAGGAASTTSSSTSPQALLGCLPQITLVDQLVSNAAIAMPIRACVALALQSAPWPTFVDVYGAFAAISGKAYSSNAAFQGRLEPFARPCRAMPADAPPSQFPPVPGLVLGDLTARWNAASARRTVAGFAPISTWRSVPNGPLATDPVSATATLVALPSSTAPTAPSIAATSQSQIKLAGAALTLRPVPDVAEAMAAIGTFVETVDSAGRISAVVKNLNLAVLLQPGSAPKRISVGNLVYTALVSAPANGVPSFQITAVING